MQRPVEALSPSAPTLRPTTADDLPAISELTEVVFGRRRSEEVLAWLLLSDGPELGLRSRVATKGGRVVGHAALLESRYRWGDRTVVGGHAFLLILAPHARGPIGIQLFRWCTGHGDFNLTVGGTARSQALMDRRRFVRSAVATELRLSTAVAAPAGDLEIGPYEPGAGVAPPDGTVVNLPSEARLRWLAACPRLESRLLSLYRSSENVGPVLLYVDRREEEPRGRIVHLPWGGGEWGEFVLLALGELAELGCGSASILASHDEQLAAAIALGGEPFYERPIFFRDRTGLPEFPGWHLSYLEGDLAYRRV